MNDQLLQVLWVATGQTLYMVGVALAVTVIVGLPLGVVLVGTEEGRFLDRLFGSRTAAVVVNRLLDFVVNLGRSVPFIILMVALIPVTRLIVGTFIGPTAAIVPLSMVAIPFFARMVEIAIKEVDPGLLEVASSLGASRWELVTKVLLPEAAAPMLLGLSTTVTSIINFSAMVGTVAGGGLGDVAIRYGYQQYSWIHIVAVIVIIFAIVMALQSLASWGARRLARRSPSRPRRPRVAAV
ncbi:ABC transporter permease [Microbacterium sp. zg.Y1090]|uniref:methionine ABC transporter permease n=1 Tax=Microbacterium TaxID=33882 RepID=UPI00214AA5D6|nr:MULTISPECIES: methionine ABC transporter permease [unclassified Microbacterium]MCR2813070.1 ABC transporter permease [Microbacterium sp. zg.Y1084]MCR2819384.1 ABC transporter permease [Microbacterium sp. zg.Y1090]MDL5487301.1 methionine ABC transporter permease [Microbacterium sp. zg-Y1211]WIM28364.1 methionine ABC transporter permease [Microbacterium sp. zg-Y1090]